MYWVESKKNRPKAALGYVYLIAMLMIVSRAIRASIESVSSIVYLHLLH